MRTLIATVCFLSAISLVPVDLALVPVNLADAKPRAVRKGKRAKRAKKKRRRPKKKLVATKQTRVGIGKLMGKYKFGMTSAQVMSQLKADIRAREEPILKAIKDPLEQDKRRREMFANIRKVKKNHIPFSGKRTPWDVSLVDKEFAHKNNESMLVSWEKMERRFFFFHHDKLWKVFIAFNAEMFQDKTFEDFARAMEARFGPAERKFSVNLSGEQKMDHLAWPQSGTTKLLAYDYTGFYGNFCLSLANIPTWENVKSGRELNSPKRKYSDPLVESVTKDDGALRDDNEDIVDRITGKGTTAPSVGGSPGTSRPDYDEPSKPRRRKKVDSKNPLEGLDI